ncbi:MAG: TetR/AcrR family transcriptional regulator [Oscillospiraceae bacterium]|nr:TetR/AcrR family transcriptional regulator [Oscillospiraceae bacterium]
MRNVEKDEIEMAARRELMLKTGFRVFSERAIEPVTMQDVADECGLGIATLYRYFNTKLVFVIAIGARKWEEYFIEVEKMYRKRHGEGMNAAEELEFFIDCIIALYTDHKDLLAFNCNLDTYVRHEGATAEQLRPYYDAVEQFAKKFHTVYEKAQSDATLKPGLSERKLFLSTLHIMLAVATKYADGLLVPAEDANDLTQELNMLKKLLLDAYTNR